ncbi:MAG: Fumarylacetoacetase, partial [Gemmatimonadetes bacterium]|nr:Fumarylacetoacetase [Gemmatimonadota bacterium]
MTLMAPGKIICVGRNYVAHARELGNDVPAVPMLFLKPPSAIIGPGDPIVLPPESGQVEYEAEIGVVMGERIRRASAEAAERAIRGFICVND